MNIDGHLLQVDATAREHYARRRSAKKEIHFVFRVDFMVKLLRACVWMPRRQKAKKDVASYDKLREAAHRL